MKDIIDFIFESKFPHERNSYVDGKLGDLAFKRDKEHWAYENKYYKKLLALLNNKYIKPLSKEVNNIKINGDINNEHDFFGCNAGYVNYYDSKKQKHEEYNFNIHINNTDDETINKITDYLEKNNIDYVIDNSYVKYGEYRICIKDDEMEKIQQGYNEDSDKIYDKYSKLMKPFEKTPVDFKDIKDDVQNALDDKNANTYFGIYHDDLLDYELYPVIPKLINSANDVFMSGKYWFLCSAHIEDETYDDVIPHNWSWSDDMTYDDCLSAWNELSKKQQDKLIGMLKNC